MKMFRNKKVPKKQTAPKGSHFLHVPPTLEIAFSSRFYSFEEEQSECGKNLLAGFASLIYNIRLEPFLPSEKQGN